MLLRILELEKITVDDVMLARSEVDAIDLDDDWEDIVAQLATSLHTRLPVYRGSLDNIIGVLHLTKSAASEPDEQRFQQENPGKNDSCSNLTTYLKERK